MKIRIFILAFSALVLAAGDLQAAQVFLKNGDRISGKIVGTTEEEHTVETEAFGIVTVPKAALDYVVEDGEDKTLPPGAAKTGAPPEEGKEAGTDAKLWSGEAAAGFDRRRGNVNTTEITGRFKVHRKRDDADRKNEFHFEANTYYSEEDRKMNARKHYGMTRYAFSFGPGLKWYDFYKFEADSDRFSNVDYRLVPSTGLGYWFYDEERTKAMAELGAGIEHTAYRHGKDDETDGVVIPRIYLEKTILKETKVSTDFTLYSPVTEPKDYRLRWESILDEPLSGNLSLRFIVLYEYNADPGTEVEKSDVRFMTSLVYHY